MEIGRERMKEFNEKDEELTKVLQSLDYSVSCLVICDSLRVGQRPSSVRVKSQFIGTTQPSQTRCELFLHSLYFRVRFSRLHSASTVEWGCRLILRHSNPKLKSHMLSPSNINYTHITAHTTDTHIYDYMFYV